MISLRRAFLRSILGGACAAPFAVVACSSGGLPAVHTGTFDAGVGDDASLAAEGAVMNGHEDGGATGADGGGADGSTRAPDGAVIGPDGAVIGPDGAVIGPDGAVVGDGGGSTGNDASSSGMCSDLTADGSLVAQTVATGAQPSPMGGTIFNGTYWLTARYTYGGAPDDLVVQKSLIFSNGNTVDIVGGFADADAGAVTTTASTSTFEVLENIQLSMHETCPGPSHTTNVLYTASGGTLTLYPTNDSAEVYELQ